MSFRDKFSQFSHLGTDWRRVLTRSVLMLVIGVTLIALTIFKPNVMLFHARDTSWLPICGFVLLAVGLLECFDALIAKELKDFSSIYKMVFWISLLLVYLYSAQATTLPD